jgi:hypothetical protein
MADDGIHRGGVQETEITYPVSANLVIVSKDGDDTNGNGTFGDPYLTITKGLASATVARNKIIALAGDYSEVALTWPNINGLTLAALGGEVNISEAAAWLTIGDPSAAVLTIAPTYTAESFEAFIKGPINLNAKAQIGLEIANAAMTKKLIVEIDGLSCEQTTSGDSISIDGTVAGQAIRVYAKNLNLEGLLHFTANDAGSRLRVSQSELMGGLTTTGAVTAESTLMGVVMLKDGLSIATQWLSSNAGCIDQTDAGVCSAFVDTANG